MTISTEYQIGRRIPSISRSRRREQRRWRPHTPGWKRRGSMNRRSTLSEIAAYGRRHSIPTIADIRDLWPDIWLDAAPVAARPIAKLLLSPYFALSRSSLASVTAITGITDEFVGWGLARVGRAAGPFDRAFPFGYSLPTLMPDT